MIYASFSIVVLLYTIVHYSTIMNGSREKKINWSEICKSKEYRDVTRSKILDFQEFLDLYLIWIFVEVLYVVFSTFCFDTGTTMTYIRLSALVGIIATNKYKLVLNHRTNVCIGNEGWDYEFEFNWILYEMNSFEFILIFKWL